MNVKLAIIVVKVYPDADISSLVTHIKCMLYSAKRTPLSIDMRINTLYPPVLFSLLETIGTIE